MERYFTLRDSTNTLDKRFRVIHGGWNPIMFKKQTEKTTLDGNYDVAQGGIYHRHEYIVKIRDDEPDMNYGNVEDLRTFFSYNEPNPSPGNPSNRLHFADHFGNQWIVMMAGDFIPQTLSVVMEGEYSSYNIKVVFLFLQPDTSS